MIDRRDIRLGRARRQGSRIGTAAARPKRAHRRTWLEPLEPRQLLAITLAPGPVVDVSRLPGNQSEESIAINPLNPNDIVVVSNNNAGKGLFLGTSTDGGNTWSQQIMADGF